MKKCSVCEIEKDDIDFYKKSGKCKKCKTEYQKQYYQKNKETKIKEYREENKEDISEYNIKYQQNLREEDIGLIKRKRKKYREEDK